jgi:hypothetical protein
MLGQDVKVTSSSRGREKRQKINQQNVAKMLIYAKLEKFGQEATSVFRRYNGKSKKFDFGMKTRAEIWAGRRHSLVNNL